MSSTQVTITSDTCTLEVRAEPLVASDPDMEFVSGSFKGTVDERRVAVVYMAIPTGSKTFTLRFEFTDPTIASTDIWGEQTYLTKEDRVTPYQEIAGANAPLSNPDVNK